MPGGAAGRGSPVPGVLARASVTELLPAASSALEAHAIKELPGHGGLFLAGPAPAGSLPAPPPAHILLPKFRFSILPLKPLGEQK